MNITFWIGLIGAVLTTAYILYMKFKPQYDDYVCKLSIIIYYNKEEQNVTADFSKYETDQKVLIRIYSVKTYDDISPEEKELEGNEIYNERAVVRCAKGTHDPMAWWYLDQK